MYPVPGDTCAENATDPSFPGSARFMRVTRTVVEVTPSETVRFWFCAKATCGTAAESVVSRVSRDSLEVPSTVAVNHRIPSSVNPRSHGLGKLHVGEQAIGAPVGSTTV